MDWTFCQAKFAFHTWYVSSLETSMERTLLPAELHWWENVVKESLKRLISGVRSDKFYGHCWQHLPGSSRSLVYPEVRKWKENNLHQIYVSEKVRDRQVVKNSAAEIWDFSFVFCVWLLHCLSPKRPPSSQGRGTLRTSDPFWMKKTVK